MRKKSILILICAVLLTAFAAYAAAFGLTVGGKTVLKPAGEGLSLGLDLRGGIYTVFHAEKGEYSDSDFDALLSDTAEALRAMLTERGYTEANVSTQGDGNVRIEIPDINDPQEIVKLIGTPAHLEFRDPNGNVIMQGRDIKRVNAEFDTQSGGYCVAFVLTDEGAQAFSAASTRLVGSYISIVVDGVTISSPRVSEPITDGRGRITLGGGTLAQAESLATRIQSGALPLDIHEIETRTISATLGDDALSSAYTAGLIGVALVMLFMLAMYRVPGLMADIALVWYIIIVFALLVLFRIQLTLPGIAGILLGIGMAVDANVVIFERFREEMNAGRSGEAALKAGYKNALRAITDANVTTLIAAFVLMYFGTGSVRGFSYTLCISVVVSMFTAVVVTRFLLKRAVRLGLTNPALYARPLRERQPFGVCALFRYTRWVPAVLILAAAVLNIFGHGIDPGLDFTGGTLIEYSMDEEFSAEEVKALLADTGYTDVSVSGVRALDGGGRNLQIRLRLEYDEAPDVLPAVERALEAYPLLTLNSSYAADREYVLAHELEEEYIGARVLLYDGDADSDKVADSVIDALEEMHIPYTGVHAYELDDDADGRQLLLYVLPAGEGVQARSVIDAALRQKYPSVQYVSMEHAGAVSSAALIKNALLSLAVALVLMLIYIAVRFDLYSGVAALAGLAHDMLIMLAAMSFFSRWYQINSPFIAALLTIVGYSINDTIVIFDRVRENKKQLEKASNEAIADISVTSSLSRTISTSVTTLFTLLALYVLGVASIKEFTFPLIAGMLAGAFSSNLINTPVWAKLLNRAEKKRDKRPRDVE